MAVIRHGRLLAEGTISEVVGGYNGRPTYLLEVDDAANALRILEGSSLVAGASVANSRTSWKEA